MIQILMIRHGPTEWNEAGRIQGRRDVPLSAVGRERVQNWRLPEGWGDARRLASPLRRAQETARLLGLKRGLEAEPALLEMDWGAWEGQRLGDLRTELGDAMAANEARGVDFRPPGGESPREVQARMLPLLRTLNVPKTIAVTHKGVIRALYALATGWTMQAKPAERLEDERAHLFGISADGVVFVERLNIPLCENPPANGR